MGDLSANFSLWEFEQSGTAKQLGIDNSVPPHLMPAVKHLCTAVLQPIRDHYGLPVSISSGYRCPKLNASLDNASPTSQHQCGEAADISIEGVELDDLMTWIVEQSGLPVDQVIREPSWIHISSCRPNRGQALLKEKDKPYMPWE